MACDIRHQGYSDVIPSSRAMVVIRFMWLYMKLRKKCPFSANGPVETGSESTLTSRLRGNDI
jgi:hypothetical protein